MSFIDTSKADIVDTSHVDAALASVRRNEENARRRALVLTWGKAVLLGGVGVAALLFAATFFVQSKVMEKQVVVERDVKPKFPEAPPLPPARPKTEAPPAPRPQPKSSEAPPAPPPAKVEAPKPESGVCEGMHFPATVTIGTSTWRCDGIGHGTLVDPSKVAQAPPPPPAPRESTKDGDDLFHTRFVAWCEKYEYRPALCESLKPKSATKEPPPPPQPAPTTETHPWDQLADKQYVGIITDVINGDVCYNDSKTGCTYAVKMDADGHIVSDSNNHSVRDPDKDFSPMVKWIGYSAYRAHRPGEPANSAIYWVADQGELIRFESAPKGRADVVMLRSDGQSLLLDVGLGAQPNETVHLFVLDTGASDLTVTADLASQLVRTGHAEPGKPETVTYADGKPHSVPTLTIDTMRVGMHVLHDVHATISPIGAPMLLGLNVLNAIGRFEVDAPHRTLTFNGGVM